MDNGNTTRCVHFFETKTVTSNFLYGEHGLIVFFPLCFPYIFREKPSLLYFLFICSQWFTGFHLILVNMPVFSVKSAILYGFFSFFSVNSDKIVFFGGSFVCQHSSFLWFQECFFNFFGEFKPNRVHCCKSDIWINIFITILQVFFRQHIFRKGADIAYSVHNESWSFTKDTNARKTISCWITSWNEAMF